MSQEELKVLQNNSTKMWTSQEVFFSSILITNQTFDASHLINTRIRGFWIRGF